MIPVAAAVVTLVGVGVLLHALRADVAVRRWRHTVGTLTAAVYAYTRSDDGREVYRAQAAFRSAEGQPLETTGGHFGKGLEERVGQPVHVWYDPRRPQRSHVALEQRHAGSPWWLYAFGLVFAAVGATVLARSLG